jgi:predicted nucleic acid-binding protein
MTSKTPLRVFLDTNVVFSGLVYTFGIPASILGRAMRYDFQAVLSQGVLDELLRNLTNKAPQSLGRLTEMTATGRFEIVTIVSEADTATWIDAGLREDAHVTAAAVTANCAVLCTGDRRLRERLIDVPLPFRVVTPRQLIELLSEA